MFAAETALYIVFMSQRNIVYQKEQDRITKREGKKYFKSKTQQIPTTNMKLFQPKDIKIIIKNPRTSHRIRKNSPQKLFLNTLYYWWSYWHHMEPEMKTCFRAKKYSYFR